MWQTVWHHNVCCTYWRHNDHFDARNVLTTSHILDILTYFLTSWLTFSLDFCRSDCIFSLFREQNVMKTCFWCYNELFDVMACFWCHDVIAYFWLYDKLFDIMMYFDFIMHQKMYDTLCKNPLAPPSRMLANKHVLYLWLSAFHIFKIDKKKYDEYIWHVYCVHYHILLSNIVSWVAKRHIDLWVSSRNSRMLNPSINISNKCSCDSLLCINPNPMHIPYHTICGCF